MTSFTIHCQVTKANQSVHRRGPVPYSTALFCFFVDKGGRSLGTEKEVKGRPVWKAGRKPSADCATVGQESVLVFLVTAVELELRESH